MTSETKPPFWSQPWLQVFIGIFATSGLVAAWAITYAIPIFGSKWELAEVNAKIGQAKAHLQEVENDINQKKLKVENELLRKEKDSLAQLFEDSKGLIKYTDSAKELVLSGIWYHEQSNVVQSDHYLEFDSGGELFVYGSYISRVQGIPLETIGFTRSEPLAKWKINDGRLLITQNLFGQKQEITGIFTGQTLILKNDPKNIRSELRSGVYRKVPLGIEFQLRGASRRTTK